MKKARTATILISFCIVLFRLQAQPQGSRRISPAGDIAVDRRVALVVGNANYRSVPLRNPGNDARAVAAALERLGFQVKTVLDATRRELDEATESFASGLRAGDLAFFYYSGHGAQLNQENFIIPVDFQGSSAADLRYNAFPAGQIRDRLEESGARVRVMILDACRDNPFRGVRGGAGGLAPMTPAVGTLIAYATAENSTADDNSGESFGLYTKYLLHALNTPGLSLKQLFEQARTNVWTQGGRKQLPYVYDGIVGDVMLTGGALASTLPASATVDPASIAWERAKNTRNRPMLEAIVQEFPDSPYARLARIELAGLTPEPKIPSPPVFDMNAAFGRAQQFFAAKNYSEALPLLRQCADNGSRDAMHLMGWFYQNGFGVAQDFHAASDWYHKAAELGNVISMHNLGALYLNGQGVAQDYATAMQWSLRASEGGAGMAMVNVGWMYENGLGVPPSRDQALSWYQKAANSGLEDGKKNLDRLTALAAVKKVPVAPPRQPDSVPPVVVPTGRIMMPAKGDLIPGTQWTFDSFGMGESPDGASAAATIPDEFGTNSRFITWSLNVNVHKNQGGAATAACEYLDGSGAIYGGPMTADLSVKSNDKGGFNFAAGWGGKIGNTWRPGNYQARCRIGDATLVQVPFRVVAAPVFFLSDQKGVYNPLLVYGSLGYASFSERTYPGELLIAREGVEWKDSGRIWLTQGQKGKSNFKAACADISVTATKDRVKLTHGSQTDTLIAASPEEAQTVSQVIRSTCGK